MMDTLAATGTDSFLWVGITGGILVLAATVLLVVRSRGMRHRNTHSDLDD